MLWGYSKRIENKRIQIISSEFDRIPQIFKELDLEKKSEVEKLIDKIEEDDDVNAVYHNLKLDTDQ